MEQLSWLLCKIMEPGSKVFDTGSETGWKQLELRNQWENATGKYQF